jgi:hypothetical protein
MNKIYGILNKPLLNIDKSITKQLFAPFGMSPRLPLSKSNLPQRGGRKSNGQQHSVTLAFGLSCQKLYSKSEFIFALLRKSKSNMNNCGSLFARFEKVPRKTSKASWANKKS